MRVFRSCSDGGSSKGRCYNCFPSALASTDTNGRPASRNESGWLPDKPQDMLCIKFPLFVAAWYVFLAEVDPDCHASDLVSSCVQEEVMHLREANNAFS